jgi:hypothetical protein
MPDSNLADASTLTSTFYNTYIREQVVVTCTSATRPTALEGRMIFETDLNLLRIYDGSSWRILSSAGWTNYTPTWTNLTLGDGSQSGEYRYSQDQIRVRGTLIFGSTTAVTGTISLLIPNSATSAASGLSVGNLVLEDVGARLYVGQTLVATSSTAIAFYHSESGNGGAVNATAPFTWAVGDAIYWDISVAL